MRYLTIVLLLYSVVAGFADVQSSNLTVQPRLHQPHNIEHHEDQQFLSQLPECLQFDTHCCHGFVQVVRTGTTCNRLQLIHWNHRDDELPSELHSRFVLHHRAAVLLLDVLQ